MTETIKTLLQPIQNRLNAATPGPWGTIADTYKSTPVHHIGADVSGVTVAQVIDHGAQTARNAGFIAHAPTDQGRLLAAVQAVIALHKPERLDGRPIHGCRVCDWEQPGNEGWPCATVAAIESALTEAR
jgi:hypothetical protein